MSNTYNEKYPAWLYNQSAVIPFRYENGELHVLLITSRRKMHWVIPKGVIERGLSPTESAEKEAFEEAGITGYVFPGQIGEYTYKKWEGTCRVKIFLMQVHEELSDWPEFSFRERRWMSIHEGAARIDDEELRQIFQQLPQYLTDISISKL